MLLFTQKGKKSACEFLSYVLSCTCIMYVCFFYYLISPLLNQFLPHVVLYLPITTCILLFYIIVPLRHTLLNYFKKNFIKKLPIFFFFSISHIMFLKVDD